VTHEGWYLLHNSPSVLPVQGHKTYHLLTSYFVTACFNIIPHLCRGLPSCLFPFQFLPNCVYIYSSVFIYNSTVLSRILLAYLGSCLAFCFHLFFQFFNAGLEQREQSSINIQLKALYDIMRKIYAHYSILNLSVATYSRIVYLINVLNSSQRPHEPHSLSGKQQMQLSNKTKAPLQKNIDISNIQSTSVDSYYTAELYSFNNSEGSPAVP
jgi:hypothetical protein